ncbi:MAG: serine hydrolase [Pseudomonadota bacterium]
MPNFAKIFEGDLALAAKVLCSSVFVAELDEAESLRHSVFYREATVHDYSIWSFGLKPKGERLADRANITVDRTAKTVSISADGVNRSAGYYGDQGCVIHPKNSNKISFDPVSVQSSMRPAGSDPWPIGDLQDKRPFPENVDRSKAAAAVEAAFADPKAQTAAFVGVYQGRIIAEGYGSGANRDTALASWSLGKSLTATLLGVLMQQGVVIGFDTTAPIPEWQNKDDPRSKITVGHLLRMSSGLDFTGFEDFWPWTWNMDAGRDHAFVYKEAINVFDFVVNRPLKYNPGTRMRYRNSDTLALGYIIRRTVEARGQNYLRFPQQDLFDRIGVRKMVLEPDVHGNFISTGFNYGRARDWARIGLLYLQDGVWSGERILPKGFVDFIRSPAPGSKYGNYGGQFWLNTNKFHKALPEDAFYMSGAGDQNVIIVPSLELVVVRMGHRSGAIGKTEPAETTLNAALERLVEALKVD